MKFYVDDWVLPMRAGVFHIPQSMDAYLPGGAKHHAYRVTNFGLTGSEFQLSLPAQPFWWHEDDCDLAPFLRACPHDLLGQDHQRTCSCQKYGFISADEATAQEQISEPLSPEEERRRRLIDLRRSIKNGGF